MVTGSNNGSLCVITAGRLTPACPNISPGSFGALRVHTTDLGGLSAPRLGGMAPSVSLSTRVSPGLRERLLAEARARRMSIGTLARELLAATARRYPSLFAHWRFGVKPDGWTMGAV